VLGERSRDTAEPLIRFPGQELSLLVPLVPQASDGKGEQRQRSPLPFHRPHHLLGQAIVLEAEAEALRRLNDRFAQALARERQ
jgi:hypothetical protein